MDMNDMTDQQLYEQVFGTRDHEHARHAAFEALKKALNEAPRQPSESDWIPIQAAYVGWQDTLAPREFQAYRAEQQGLRAKLIEAYQASPQALLVDAFERLRGRVYNARRERKKARANAQQGYDVHLRRAVRDDSWVPSERDWKAPEALL